MDISLVILNYKQKGLVKQCVKGIVASRPQLEYEIIVVDNASHDGVIEEVNALFADTTLGNQPTIKTIQAETNAGMGAGNNIGMHAARGRYIFVLNPDVAVVPESLEKMVAYMDAHDDIGILGPRLINPDGSIQESCRRFPSAMVPLYRRTALGKLPFARKTLAHHLMADIDHTKTQAVDWLFGAALLIRASALDSVGYFDERFFLYFEDLDLCRRFWEKRYSVYYYPEVELVHYHQRLSAESRGLKSLFKKATRIHLMSGIKYFAKYFGAQMPR